VENGENSNHRKLKKKAKRRRNRKNRKLGTSASQMEPETIAVVFVEHTVNGELAKRLQKAEDEMARMTGFRIRVTEMAGSQLRRILPNTNPWQGQDCLRQGCVPCGQGGERLEDCRRRNILYESSCMECNEKETLYKKGAKLSDCVGVYVGESGRSLHERAGEHQHDAGAGTEDSHMIKHWSEHHGGSGDVPKFHFKLIGSFQDALTRQVSEAVRIDLRGGGVLNSKSEYSRCKLPRLTIDRDTWNSQKQETINNNDKDLEDKMFKDMADKLEDGLRPITSLMAGKRRKENKPEKQGRKKKRLKLDPLVGWGEGEGVKEGEEGLEIENWLLRSERENQNNVGGGGWREE
jgi:hypothetical protein